ncbi:MAG: hypothetical protein IPK63_09950 [Candidatus Competibacteraceae bacterium]|nr:hypothetical protein [Candidatus Competibacteraceae bacterium]
MIRLTEPRVLSQYRQSLRGLVSGFAPRPGQRIEPLANNELEAVIDQPDTLVWRKLDETTARVRGKLDEMEDQILTGRVRGQHAQMSGIRRLTARLVHHLGPNIECCNACLDNH